MATPQAGEITEKLPPELEQFLAWLRGLYETDEGQGQDFRVFDLIERGHQASSQQLAGWLRVLVSTGHVEYIANDTRVRNRHNRDTYVPVKPYYWLVGGADRRSTD